MRTPSVVLLSLISLLCLEMPRVAFATQEGPAPDFGGVILSENDCSFLIQFNKDPRPLLGDIRCGTLDVPENWNDAAGRRLLIGYVVLESTSPSPAMDPVVYLDGGPGSSPLTGVATFADAFAGLRDTRDVVLFDQRGTRLSSPLRCSALGAPRSAPDEEPARAEPPPLLYPDEVGDGYEILQQARLAAAPAAADCALEVLAAGADPRQYNSIASANDAVALVKALGYDTYNLYGISYGTRLALVVMRDHPDSGLRSVVLDSTFPPEIKGFEQLPAEAHEVVIQLFADCALDASCNAAYPDLKARFVALLDQLAASPVVTPDGLPIDDRDVVMLMQGLTGQVHVVPFIPRMIEELERGVSDTFVAIATGALVADATEQSEAAESEETSGIAAATPFGGDGAERPEASPARAFLSVIQERIDTLPDEQSSALISAMLNLDALAHERETLEDFVRHALGDDDNAEFRQVLLEMLAAMSDRDVAEVFAIVADTISLLDFLSFGMNLPQFNSVECNEEIPFQSFERTIATAQNLEIPQLALGTVQTVAQQFANCEVWPSGRAPEYEERAVASAIPTLILAGAYDLPTPVSWNKTAFVNLANGFFVEFPMAGHGVIMYSDCAKAVTAAFVVNPATLPDTSCVADLKPEWVLPDVPLVVATPAA